MWIDFECNQSRDYMIKIYVGGVNAISGEPAVEDAGTRLRRQAKIARIHDKGANKRNPPLQDYTIVPGQQWPLRTLRYWCHLEVYIVCELLNLVINART